MNEVSVHESLENENELDLGGYVEQQQQKQLLRFLTCGSVDDGKSTLIGRLLHDSAQIYDDQLATLEQESARIGSTGDKLDLALLVDGLQAEREQGITIDVAYRYFSTDKRKFIIADTPGHEQYTRNMATGASTCDVAVILIDARYGVQTQTRRHAYIASLLGIKHLVIAINKMDLMGFEQSVFKDISEQFAEFSKQLAPLNVDYVPLSALDGDNVVNVSSEMPWYQGQTLLLALESIDLDANSDDKTITQGFRFPVQHVQRPHLNFRGFSGYIASGHVRVGDPVTILPSGKQTQVVSIVTFDGNLDSAQTGQAITITLADEVDVSRGDLIVSGDDHNLLPTISNSVTVDLVWLDETPLEIDRLYNVKVASKLTQAKIVNIDHIKDINSLETTTGLVGLNTIARVQLQLVEALPLEAYSQCQATGSLILIDRLSNATLAALMVVNATPATFAKSTTTNSSARYSAEELALNAWVREYYPHWNAKDLSQS
ncbi:sulfate adenylyltransferase subunit CysN [Parashewanella spongiae]|uniref:Sulfate adenylyltransferase subunit 1 n=1 Tax=Parashewanella spongiae TaxID=342950 RepID=A0A3A6U7Q7_9GAMM|nr:sulfate adenylyltransferase subunit CysN [Parashewanella spongiae]MCL1078720.1 sulfate adenylyltransferase subunit CysN [Parashewanella spongiae]RJY17501.1 sulfate adenylyltransferase subunit CysN [Parashewanella spongiae]